MMNFRNIYLFACIIITNINCSTSRNSISQPKTELNYKQKEFTPASDIDITRFELKAKVAMKMIKYYEGCKTEKRKDNTTLYDSTDVVNAINAYYPVSTQAFVNARFKNGKEKRFYRRHVRPYQKSKAYRVRNYKTHLYKVDVGMITPVGSNVYSASTKFYMVTKICPPPLGCNVIN